MTMTREEVIKILKRELEPEDGKWHPFEEVKEALDMAIEALKIDLVWCNDCWFFSNDKYEECRYYIAHGIRRKPNDFCSYGKRKGGDTK